MKVGIIGVGNMGRILAEALLDGGGIAPGELTLFNRTASKAEALQNLYPGVNIADSASGVAAASNVIFVCVKPLDMHPVIQDIQSFLTEDKCLVSITSPVSADQLEKAAGCSCIRAIPSITNRALAGVTLITKGRRCSIERLEEIKHLLSAISVPIEIPQDITRAASDIVSCGPAFFSYLTRRFVKAATEETAISEELATVLAGEMLVGMGELLKKGYYTLPALQEKVCVKGGVTGEGIKVLEAEIGDVFHKVFRATNEKFREDLEQVESQFGPFA